MNFAQQQRDPRKHLIGISTVVLLHAVVIYALANGLARKVVDVLKKPLEMNLIAEVQKLPPPPLAPKIVLQPKITPPPQAFVPQVEVQIQNPTPAPVIAATTPLAPPAPPAPAPAAPVIAVPKTVSVGVVCPGYQTLLAKGLIPAQVRGLNGRVTVEFTISAAGAVGGITVLKSSSPALNAIATAAVSQLHCEGQGQSVRAQVPIVVEQER